MSFKSLIIRLAFCAAMLQVPLHLEGNPTVAKAAIVNRVVALYKKFVDIKNNKGLSWKCFASRLSALLKDLPEYKTIAEQMRKESETAIGSFGANATAIALGYRLQPLKSKLPEEVRKILDQKSGAELLGILTFRLQVNQPTCQT